MEHKRVLIVSRWQHVVAISRLPLPLSEAGFAVAALCPDDSFLARSQHLSRHFTCSQRVELFVAAFIRAVADFNPDLIVPGSSWDRAFLQRVISSPLAIALEIIAPGSRKVFVRSLGSPLHQATLVSKHKQQRFAEDQGIPTPCDRSVSSALEAFDYAEANGFPVVLKQDFNSGGKGVWICYDRLSLEDALRVALSSRAGSRTFRQRSRQALNYLALVPALQTTRRPTVQKFINGKDFIHNFVALDGEWMAGVTVETIRKHPSPTGPCSVVRARRSEQIERYARALVKSLGFSGFGCMDFIRKRSTSEYYFIECNPIPTNVAHLSGVLGSDLFRALYARMAGLSYQPQARAAIDRPVALFPQELNRDPSGRSLNGLMLDVSESEPELVRAISSHFGLDLRSLTASRGHVQIA